MNKLLYLIFIVIPSIAYANAIVPLINIFTPSTMIPATILTIFIILLEAYLLKRWQKDILFKKHLKHSFFNNIISSAVGSIAILLFVFKQPLWNIISLYPAMLLLTVIIETPLLKYEYNHIFTTWGSAIKKSLSIHIISYGSVFLFQPILFMLLAVYLNFLHTQNLKNWTDESILKNEIGSIYTIESVRDNNQSKSKKFLFEYDIETKTKHKINFNIQNDISSDVWDIKGDIFAFSDKFITVVDMNSSKYISKINKHFKDISISPDQTMIAGLEYKKEVRAYNDEFSYFWLGTSYILKVFDIQSGRLLFQSPRLALERGISWSSDSKNIIFTSLQDSDVLLDTKQDYLTRGYGRFHLKDGQYPMGIYIYNLQNQKVDFLIEGEKALTIPKTNDIIFIDKSKLYQMSIKEKKPYIIFDKLGYIYSYAISPSGKKLLIPIPNRTFLSHSHMLTMIDLDNTDKRFIIYENFNGKVKWINQKIYLTTLLE